MQISWCEYREMSHTKLGNTANFGMPLRDKMHHFKIILMLANSKTAIPNILCHCCSHSDLNLQFPNFNEVSVSEVLPDPNILSTEENASF